MMNEKQLSEQLIVFVGEMIDQRLDEQALDKAFSELGVDSLMALELAVRIEREYRIRLEESELSQIASLQDVVAIILTKAGG